MKTTTAESAFKEGQDTIEAAVLSLDANQVSQSVPQATSEADNTSSPGETEETVVCTESSKPGGSFENPICGFSDSQGTWKKFQRRDINIQTALTWF